MSRFAHWKPWQAQLVLAWIVVMVVLGARLSPVPHIIHLSPPGVADWTLYRVIADRVMNGENYYLAAAAQHRAWSYPIGPPQVFREPTLAWILALLRTEILRRGAVIVLSIATFIAMRHALVRTGMPERGRFLAIPLIGSGIAIAWGPAAPYLHDVWASLLIALSLALYRPDRWVVSVVLGVAACLLRELALPYLVAMAGFALYERRRREVVGWAAGAMLFAVLFAWHLSRAAQLLQPGDHISSGWLSFGGWPFVLQAARDNLALIYAPNAVIAIVVCIALVGFLGARNPFVSRAGVIVGGYMAAFLFVGRPDNGYWGMLFSPLLPLGVAVSPAAMRDLVAAAWGSRPLPRTAQRIGAALRILHVGSQTVVRQPNRQDLAR